MVLFFISHFSFLIFHFSFFISHFSFLILHFSFFIFHFSFSGMFQVELLILDWTNEKWKMEKDEDEKIELFTLNPEP
jgi:hypothetical protein